MLKVKKRRNTAYLYVLPAMLIVAVFMLYPILFNFKYSFFKWDGISAPTAFVGLKNYISFFKNPSFVVILRNTLVYAALTVIFQYAFGMISAVMLTKITRYRSFFSALLFLPVVITPSILGLVAAKIFDPTFGPVNKIFRAIGLEVLAQPWLAQTWTAMLVICLIVVWQWSGFFTIFYSAGISNIPEEIYEAAVVDGAGEIRIFFNITLPMLKSTHYSLAILSGASVLKVFDIVWVLTEGGPYGSTEFFSTYILKKSYLEYNQGASSAISIVLFFLTLMLTAIQLVGQNKKEKE